MTNDEIKTIFTCGGCGILAQEIIALRPDAVPVMWKDSEGYPTHAAVLVGSRLVHLGNREDGYEEVTQEQLDESVRFDFDPRIGKDDCRELARRLAEEIVNDL